MDINLDGGENTILKAIGTGGTTVSGTTLLGRIPNMEVAEIIDTLKGLIAFGYVSTDAGSIQTLEDLEKAEFQINSGYAKDIKEALDPRPQPVKSRRVRRE